MVDRVRKPEKHTDTLSFLKDDAGIFASYKDILVFAAALGFSRGKSVEFDKSSEPIPLSVFRGEYDKAFMNVLVLFENKDPGYLESEGEKFNAKIKLFEEYACGGMDIIKNTIIDPGLDPQNELIRLILDEETNHSIIDDITALGV